MKLVLVEHKSGIVSEASLAALTAAAQLGGPVCALVLGNALDAETLKAHGVEKVFQVQDERLDTYAPMAAGKAVHQALSTHTPEAVLAGSTPQANEVLARAAALGDWGFASACTALFIEGQVINLTRLIWGGSLFQEAQLTGSCKLITVDPAAFAPQPAAAAGAATVEPFAADLQDGDFVDQLKTVEKGEHKGISLTEAKVVVGVGRGVGDEAGFAVLDELAALLNGAVGVSRVATNNGWRPHADQIGQTGAQIAPDVYIACGISGAIQHMVGCKNSKNIIAINKDPDAPIFQRATHGVLGDLHEILPALVEALKAAKAA